MSVFLVSVFVLIILIAGFNILGKLYFLNIPKSPNYDAGISQQLGAVLKEANFASPSQIVISGDTVTASIAGYTVKFSRNKDFLSQVKTLQLVLGKIKIEGRIPREIDLRFTKIVLRY